MRISDWSSDVCSSDLLGQRRRRRAVGTITRRQYDLGGGGVDHGAGGSRQRQSIRLTFLGQRHIDAVEPAPARTAPADPPHPQIATRQTLGAYVNRRRWQHRRSEEHTSELQSLMRISYAVFCLKKKKKKKTNRTQKRKNQRQNIDKET